MTFKKIQDIVLNKLLVLANRHTVLNFDGAVPKSNQY